LHPLGVLVKVFAIDPGNEESAWCVLVDGQPFESGKEPNAELLERAKAGEKRAGCSPSR
jgi:hypothetical protein